MINSASYLAERAQSKRLLESLEFTRLHLVMADMRVVPFIQFRPGPLRAPISRRAASFVGAKEPKCRIRSTRVTLGALVLLS
jgi:hypothetical protein